MRKYIILSILAIITLWNIGSASDFSFFLLQGKLYPHINNGSAIKNCESYTRKDSILIVSPECILAGELPKLSLQDRADAVWTVIESFWTGYLSDKEFIIYKPEKVSIDKTKSIYPLSKQEKKRLTIAKEKGETVEIPLSAFAKAILPELAFFISQKDLSNLKPCTKFNYLLAFNNLDWKVIPAGEQFNFNQYLSSLKGYCKWLWGLDLRFYWGVCGVASQLFRASLTHPLMETPTRRGHSEWFSVYYGEKVEGDDAAVYEKDKQLVLKNNAPSDTIIKTFKKGEMSYLVLISEAKEVQDKRVEIQKIYQTPLQVKLLKESYQKEKKSDTSFLGKIPFWIKDAKESIQNIGSENFTSRYTTITSENR